MNKDKFSPVKNYVVPLISLIEKDKDAITVFTDEIKTRGYAFVRLPPQMIDLIDSCLPKIENFFNSDITYKKSFHKPPIFGYFDVKHKQSFRFLTGDRLKEHRIPYFFEDVSKLIKATDALMYKLTLNCAPLLFPNLAHGVKQLDIPFFSNDKKWGMFDITSYHNDGTRKRLNCEEHFDPGLLSISLRSTQPGLQLKDEFGRWIKAPIEKHLAVIWTGEAAVKVNSELKPGVHRVVNPEEPGKPRIALWHEICRVSQEHKELLKYDRIKSAIEHEKTTGIPISKTLHS